MSRELHMAATEFVACVEYGVRVWYAVMGCSRPRLAQGRLEAVEVRSGGAMGDWIRY